MDKLLNFPPVHFVSIEESEDRRKNLRQHFGKYGITNLTPHIFQKYRKGLYDVKGEFVDWLVDMSIGPTTSHLKAIKEWYEYSDEEYAFFCEDDLSLETVDYWNFTWSEFFGCLPDNWEIVQLCVVSYTDIKDKVKVSEWQNLDVESPLVFRSKTLNDWSAAAYIIKRSYAKKLIDLYLKDDVFTLTIPNTLLGPIVENILFEKIGVCYSFPLFVEDVINTKSTYAYSETVTQGDRHMESYHHIIRNWREYGQFKDVKTLTKYKGIKVVQVGSNRGKDDLYNYLNWYCNQIEFGLFVEPNIIHNDSLKECYGHFKNAHIENVAIKIPTDCSNELTLYHHSQDIHGEVISADIEHVKKHQIYWYPGEISSFTVPCITLEELLDKYSIKELDWLLIDIEGIDAEIISTFNWSKYNIKRVEFEHIHLGDRAEEIKSIFLDMGYVQVDSLHEFDWAFEKNHLIEKMKGFPPVYYVSLEESENRRISLRNKFNSFGIHNICGNLFKRIELYTNKITGPFVHECSMPNLGAATSHLKAIRRWYEETQEPYAFFCEDDLSLETVKYWNFTWNEFFNNLPKDWEAVQLVIIKQDGTKEFSFNERHLEDWSAGGYLISRSYAKKLVDDRFNGSDFHLDMSGTNLIPAIEQILFAFLGKVYSFPLFVEDTKIPSTYSKPNTQHKYHEESMVNVLEWWKHKGSKLRLEQIFERQHDK